MNTPGQHYISGPQWLAEQVLCSKWVLAVAGTHGKTTTASLLAWVLEQNGLNPSFLIGGVPGGFGVSARLTNSNYFVIEADEYDTAFFDKRSKFVHYRPKTAVLNNLEFDHADIFPDLAAIETQFHHLIRTVPGDGAVIANGSEPALERVLARGCWSELQWFNSANGWQAQALEETAEASRFKVSRTLASGQAQALGECDSPMSGAHSRANALAVIAAAAHVGITPSQAMDAIARFPGVKRRMELRGEQRGVQVIDDFAHHPTAIATTIAGLRARLSQTKGASRRILAVLEPRSNTMKLGVVKAALAESLSGADLVFCYSKGLSWNAQEALAAIAERTVVSDLIDAFVAAIVRHAKSGDVILVMSNGGFEGIHERLLQALKASA